MLLEISHFAFQQYWWVLISILGSLLVFLMFVQGGQTLIYNIGKDETERSMLVNVLGRKWETTFTTLVTFGGAFFASFPLFYSTSFGGAYWLWMAILFSFIIQAISYEYRSKPNNFLGPKTYDTFLFINGAFGTFLIGVAVASFFTGSQFSVNEMNFSKWENPLHGLETIANIKNILLGLSVFLLARILGILYFIKNIDDENLNIRSRKHLVYNAVPFVLVFISFIVIIMLSDGYAYHPESKVVSLENHKYLHNFIQMPLVLMFFLMGVGLVLFGIFRTYFYRNFNNGIFFTGAGTILTVFSLFIIAGFNNTAFYPSTYDIQSSLTIENSSSSYYTLKTMSYVSLLIPFVVTYIVIAWRSINRQKLNKEEIQGEGHKY